MTFTPAFCRIDGSPRPERSSCELQRQAGQIKKEENFYNSGRAKGPTRDHNLLRRFDGILISILHDFNTCCTGTSTHGEHHMRRYRRVIVMRTRR